MSKVARGSETCLVYTMHFQPSSVVPIVRAEVETGLLRVEEIPVKENVSYSSDSEMLSGHVHQTDN